MRPLFLTTAFTLLLLCASIGYAQDATGALSADNFITEAQGGSTDIAAPAEVSVKNDVVTAATMQDAANKATELTFKIDEPPFKLITSKSGGVGAIASGRASYKTNATNKDAIHLAIRHAYIAAFMEAKKNLAQGFNGLSNEGKTVLTEALTTIVGSDESLKNSGRSMEEVIQQRIAGFVRGYTIRQVKDIPGESSICVTISVNGKSLGKFARPVPAVIETADVRTGITQAFDEIQRGIALPAGARAIITDSGETCFIGYGSALILDDDDPGMRSNLMNEARRIAETRALDSLSGMLNGDSLIWENKLSEKYVSSLKDFVDVSGNDATADLSQKGIQKLAQRKEEMLTRTSTQTATQSIRRGEIPPGVVRQTFRDNDNVWYYAVAVYNPVVTQATADLVKEMQNATLIQPIRSGSSTPMMGTDGKPLQSDVPRPSADLKMIPTGSFDDE
jgi:hypothetical protein